MVFVNNVGLPNGVNTEIAQVPQAIKDYTENLLINSSTLSHTGVVKDSKNCTKKHLHDFIMERMAAKGHDLSLLQKNICQDR